MLVRRYFSFEHVLHTYFILQSQCVYGFLRPKIIIKKNTQIRDSAVVMSEFVMGRVMVVSKSGNPGPGPVPNSYFLYYIFIKALILIKFEHNA